MTPIRNLVLALLACCLVSSPAFADAGNRPNGGEIALDAFVVRPIGLVVATVSTAVFISTLAITGPTGVSHDAGYLMMAAPWRFTAARPLGDFKHYLDGRDIRGFALESPGATRARRDSR